MPESIENQWSSDEETAAIWQGLDERVRQEIRTIAFRVGASLMSEIESCESPIEQLLGIWIVHLANLIHFSQDGCFVLNPQAEIQTAIGTFRVDFLIAAKVDGQYVSVIVECDGHDFHEKTKDQAVRDKKRDRALKSEGYDVLHFTGSEIWRDPRSCAHEVLLYLKKAAAMKNALRE